MSALCYTIMVTTRTPQQVLAEIAAIQRMERGSIGTTRKSTGYEHYNHTSHENGKPKTWYVRRAELAELKELLAAHKRFEALVNDYEELIVQKTRQEREAKRSRQPGKK